MNEVLRCPTCRTPWRSVTTCPRCGSDLSAIMRVAVKAWELREAARAALCAGDRPAEALALARAACRLHATRHGQRLLTLALVAAGQMAKEHDHMAQPPIPYEPGDRNPSSD
jgi:predicted amidophosphoribosyltransferase